MQHQRSFAVARALQVMYSLVLKKTIDFSREILIDYQYIKSISLVNVVSWAYQFISVFDVTMS